jgi:hypothetical protein
MDTPTNFLITPGASDGHMSNEALNKNDHRPINAFVMGVAQ